MRWPCAQVIAISRSVRESVNAEDLSIGSNARVLHVFFFFFFFFFFNEEDV